MADSIRTQTLLILIRAQNQATKAMEAASAEAEATGSRISRAFKRVQIGLGAVGVAAAGALVEATKQASEYATMLVHIQANTGLTDAQTQAMSAGIMKMAAQTGAPLEQLADGFMHIHNFGFDAADAMKILQPAMESALSTGDDVATVASTLGVALHEFKLNADDASAAMNVLHLAAQEGNATLGQFVDGTTRAFNLAGGFGVKLQDVAAALSTLTQSGQTARNASDGLSSVMNSIVKPTAAATSMINTLSKATGVNLVDDFSAAGLKARGLTNVILDVQTAINKMGGESATQRKTLSDYAEELAKNNVTGDAFVTKMTAMARSIGDPTQALIALFPNIRAFREMMLLTGSQSDSFAKHVKDMGAAMAGSLDPTTQGFKRQQATMSAQLSILDTNLQIIAIQIGSVLLPILNKMLVTFSPIIQGITAWVSAHPQLTAGILATVAALGLLSGGMAVLEILLGPLVGIIGAVGAPLIAVGAAAFLLYKAWQTDFGGIREITEAVWAEIHPVFDAMGQAFDTLHKAFNAGGIQGLVAALPGAMGGVGNALGTLGGVLGQQFSKVDWAGIASSMATGLAGVLSAIGAWLDSTGVPYLHAHLGNWAREYWTWATTVDGKLFAALGALLGRLGSWLDSTGVPFLRAHVGPWATAFSGWVVQAGGTLLGLAGHQLDLLVAWMHSRAALLILNAAAVWSSHFVDWVIQAGGELLGKAGHQLDLLVAWMHSRAALLILNAAAVWSSHFVDWVVAAGGDLLGKAGHQIDLFVAYMKGPAGKAIMDQAGAWATAFAQWVVKAGGDLLGLGGHQIDNFVAYMKGPAGRAITDQTGVWATDFAQWVIGAGEKLLSDATAAWGRLDGYLQGKATDMLNAAAQSLLDTLEAPFKDLANWFYSAGSNLVQGLINGIESMGSKLTSAVTSGITDKVKNIPVVSWLMHSPSQLYFGYAVNVVQGFINGLKSAAGALGTASAATAAAIPAGFSAAIQKAMTATNAGIATLGNARSLTTGATSEQTKALKDLAEAAKWEQRAGSATSAGRARTDVKREDAYQQKADIALQAAGIIAGYAVRADAQVGVNASAAQGVLAWAQRMTGQLTSAVSQQAATAAFDKRQGINQSVAASHVGALAGGSATPADVGIGSSAGTTVGSGGGSLSGSPVYNITVNVQRGAVTVEGGDADEGLGRKIGDGVGAFIEALVTSQLRSPIGANKHLPGAA